MDERHINYSTTPAATFQEKMTRFRYPKSGDLNPKTSLHVISFCVRGGRGGEEEESEGEGEVFDFKFRSLSSESKLGRWIGLWDYKVQCGWVEGGREGEKGEGMDVWVDLLDRRQQTRSVVSFPLDCFVEGEIDEGEDEEGGDKWEEDEDEDEEEEEREGREMSFVGPPLFLTCNDIEGVPGLFID